MSDPHSYTRGTEVALIALSQGTCYWPGCTEPTVRDVEGTPIMNLEFAHIAGAKRGSARYDEDMNDDERRSFANMLLLCHSHHQKIDGREWRDYPAVRLYQWKQEREAGGLAEFRGLRNLTEERLEELLVAATDSAADRINQALEQLAQHDQESAMLLRVLLGRFEEMQSWSGLLRGDSAELLMTASLGLSGLSDTAEHLDAAADKLGGLGLEAQALALQNAASRMEQAANYLLEARGFG